MILNVNKISIVSEFLEKLCPINYISRNEKSVYIANLLPERLPAVVNLY